MALVSVAVLLLAAADSASAQAAPNNGGNNPTNQNPTQQEDGIQGFWEVRLPGGRFVVPIAKISSVAEHTYVADGTRVYEVTVDTDGNQTARFYYLTPASESGPLGLTKNAIDRVTSVAKNVTQRTGNEQVWSTVVKNYPSTTHARTAEYRVKDPAILSKIYEHVYRVWAEERGRKTGNILVVTDG